MQIVYYKSDQMLIYLILIVTLPYSTHSEMVALKQWSAGAAHTHIAISVCIYNDNSKFVSGSNDMTVKVWSMQDYSLLHTQTFTDIITHISLHPVDNRIFILVFDGTIKVLDPNNYAALHTGSYPTAGGNGNFLRFFASNSKYVIAGYDVTAPILHIFDSTTYASVAGGPTTTFASGEQATVSSVSKDGQILAAISTQSAAPINLLLYSLATNSQLKAFVDNYRLLKWVQFSPNLDQLYVTSNDMTLKTLRINPITQQYDISYSFSTQPYGFPNCINANIKNQLIFTANSSIVFLNISATYPSLIFSRKDLADVFVIDVSVDGKYLVSGMRNGEITLWQIGATPTKNDQDVMLLIVLGASVGAFIAVIVGGLIVCHCCCRKQQTTVHDETKTRVKKNTYGKRVTNKTENSIEVNQVTDNQIVQQ